jgi:bromodomain-containing factor 1
LTLTLISLIELTKKQHFEFNWPFLAPVDPVALGIPTYFTIIKRPMDLSTMKKKLDANDYFSSADYEGITPQLLTIEK